MRLNAILGKQISFWGYDQCRHRRIGVLFTFRVVNGAMWGINSRASIVMKGMSKIASSM